jgi:YHS domain-containing protein
MLLMSPGDCPDILARAKVCWTGGEPKQRDRKQRSQRGVRILMSYVSRRLLIASILALSAVAPLHALAGAAGTDERAALRGYDPVSYFLKAAPEKGSPEFTGSYDDATYWFASAEHRALFLANPDRYAPQFRGFCTIDVSRGVKTEPDPEAWTIVDGKLYVFGKKRGPGVFAQDGAAILAKATDAWPKLNEQPK